MSSAKLVATVTAGVNPAGLAITSDSRYAYVANNNNYGLPGYDSVTVIDLRKNLPLTTIYDSSFNGAYTVIIRGHKAYVTNSNASTISIIDTNTNTVIGVINGLDGPSGMVINGNIAYVNNYGAPSGAGSGNGNTVSVVDLTTNMIVGPPIVVGLAPATLTISSNKKYVYVANYVDGNPNTGTISKISTKTNTVVATIGPFASNGLSGPFAIALSGNDRLAYLTNFGSNNFWPFGTTLSVVDLCSNTIRSTVNLGIQPSGLALTPNGRYALVSNYNTLYADITYIPLPVQYNDLTAGQGTINIIDRKTNQVIGPTILVGQSPANIAVSPDGRHAYVTSYIANSVSVIKL